MNRFVRCGVLVGCLLTVACLDEDAIRVASISFDGASSFSATDLKRIIETRQGGRWPWSRWRGFDEDVVERDLDRLRAFYRDRGFDEAIVRIGVIDLADDKRSVRVRIVVDEGTPRLITRSQVEFVEAPEAFPDALRTRLERLDAGAGTPRDIVGPIADSLAKALDLDVFEIQTAEAGTLGATVVVGRQVSDKLFVGFRHEFGAEGVNRLTFEYRLTEYLRIMTSVAPGGQPANRSARTETAGIDLIFVFKR